MPDSYILRAGTSAIIKENHAVSFVRDGKPERMFVVKVQILEGEFKGKMLFTPMVNAFRYVADEGLAPQSKATSKKRLGRRPAADAVPPDAKLVLTDLAVNPTASGNYVKVDGRLRCTSDAPVRGIQVTVSFEDRDGKLVRSVDGYCDPTSLSPGDVGSIAVMAESDARYSRVKIDFKDLQKTIPWVDRSGMNAHQ